MDVRMKHIYRFPKRLLDDALGIAAICPLFPCYMIGGCTLCIDQLAYEALRQWIKQTYHRDISYHTLYPIVRTKLKVPRPSHTKKPLMPSGHFRRPVAGGCRVSSRPRTPVQSRYSVRTTVVLAYRRGADGGSRPAASSRSACSSPSSSGSTLTGPWPRSRASASFRSCRTCMSTPSTSL